MGLGTGGIGMGTAATAGRYSVYCTLYVHVFVCVCGSMNRIHSSTHSASGLLCAFFHSFLHEFTVFLFFFWKFKLSEDVLCQPVATKHFDSFCKYTITKICSSSGVMLDHAPRRNQLESLCPDAKRFHKQAAFCYQSIKQKFTIFFKCLYINLIT